MLLPNILSVMILSNCGPVFKNWPNVLKSSRGDGSLTVGPTGIVCVFGIIPVKPEGPGIGF